MPNLRLAAEIECYPTWVEAGDVFDNVAPEELPISPALAAALNEWSERWDAIYDMDDPASASFSSDAEEQRFMQDGEKLAALLRSELGSDWTVHLILD